MLQCVCSISEQVAKVLLQTPVQCPLFEFSMSLSGTSGGRGDFQLVLSHSFSLSLSRYMRVGHRDQSSDKSLLVDSLRR